MKKKTTIGYPQLFGRVVLTIAAVKVAAAAYTLSLSPDPGALINQPPFGELYRSVQYIGATLLLLYLLQCCLDKRPFRELGFSFPLPVPQLAFGLVLGGGLVTAAVAAQAASGAVRYGGLLRAVAAWPAAWVYPLAGFIQQVAVAVCEEGIMRGYLLQTLRRKLPSAAAILVMAAVFSLLHHRNIGYFSPLVILNLFLFGAVCGVMALRGGNLWTAVGFHLMWNWVQYDIIPVATAPAQTSHTLLALSRNAAAPAIFTGGVYGVEGSIFATAVAVGLLWYFGLPARIRPSVGPEYRG